MPPDSLVGQDNPGIRHCEPSPICYLTRTAAGAGLVWEEWDDVFVVYQPSSTETHLFNETTVLILQCLEQGPLLADEVKVRTEEALGVGKGGLATDDFAFASMRLEELGLIEGAG